MAEAHLERLVLSSANSRGCRDGHGRWSRRAQVLADGEDVAMNGGEIAEDLQKLAGLFAQPTMTPDLVTPAEQSPWQTPAAAESAVARPGPDDAIETRTDSVLWLSTSGRASTTIRIASSLP